MTKSERAIQLIEDARESLIHVAHVMLEHPKTPAQAAVQDLLQVAIDAAKAAKRQIEFDEEMGQSHETVK